MSATELRLPTRSHVKRFIIEFSTDGNNDMLNLTPQINERLKGIGGDGLVHLFAVGSTTGLITVEHEPGLIKHDLPTLFEKLVPEHAPYEHERTWNDDNGHSHVRSSLFGTELTVPFAAGKLLTGEYQQIVFVDFDTRPRKRKVIATVMV
jgi:secondary thiamine-phosphate synthase enzyme